MLAGLPNPVRLVFFTQEKECEFCRQAGTLLDEVKALSDKLSLEVYDMVANADKAAEYKVDKAPAIVVAGEKDYGIRYFGVPAGFEFTTLLNLIDAVGKRESGLKPETRHRLATLTQPADLQMFVTLTCPVCPFAALTAARFALESDKVSLSIIDAAEFTQLSNLYDVMATPKTVVNREYSFQGLLPEERFVEEVLKGALPAQPPDSGSVLPEASGVQGIAP
jgi:glutaredoxin-like protein